MGSAEHRPFSSLLPDSECETMSSKWVKQAPLTADPRSSPSAR